MIDRYPPPGNVVSVGFIFYKHGGIVSDRWHDGKPMVISNSQRRLGVYEEPWDDFCQGRDVMDEGYRGILPKNEVLQRARSLIGERWRFFTFNCDHFVEFANGLAVKSPQLRAWGKVAGSFLLVLGAVAMARR